MIDLTKRVLLASGLALTTVPLFASIKHSEEKVFLPSNVERELLVVYAEWRRQHMEDPTMFLSAIYERTLGNISSLEAVFASDFGSGRTFKVKGLVLSITEAALLSYLGSKVLEERLHV